MKFNNINRSKFNEIVNDFKHNGLVSFTMFKKLVIGSVIDNCFHNGDAIMIDNIVYTAENDSRSGWLYEALDNIDADTINEWIARVNLLLVP